MAYLGFYLLLLLSFHFLSAISDSTTDPNPAATNFIKASCRATLYPALCIDCLSSYADTIQQNPKQLAQVALSVSLARAQTATDFVSSKTKVSGLMPREFQAVKDCVANMYDSVDQLKRSIQELSQMGGQDFSWHVSNVQTWVSAALTDENTCVDGFSGLDGNVKADIKSRVVDCAQVTSNALALVNRFATRHRGGKGKGTHVP